MPECLRIKETWARVSLRDGPVWAGFHQTPDRWVGSRYFVSPTLVSQWSHRDRVRSCEISQHPGRALGFAEVAHWLRAQSCPGFDGHPGFFDYFSIKLAKLQSMDSVHIWNRRKALAMLILLHIVLCGNILVNLNFLLTWQTKGAVSFHTQAFTGLCFNQGPNIQSVYVLKEIRLDVGGSFVKEEMLNYYPLLRKKCWTIILYLQVSFLD